MTLLHDNLHWLSIEDHVNFKIGMLTYKALNEFAPSYLLEMFVPVTVNPTQHRNGSADRGDLIVAQVEHISYGNRSFAMAAPMLWNSFSAELCQSSSMTILFNSFMTILFRAAYNITQTPTNNLDVIMLSNNNDNVITLIL